MDGTGVRGINKGFYPNSLPNKLNCKQQGDGWCPDCGLGGKNRKIKKETSLHLPKYCEMSLRQIKRKERAAKEATDRSWSAARRTPINYGTSTNSGRKLRGGTVI